MSEKSTKAQEQSASPKGRRLKWRKYLIFLTGFIILLYLLSLVLLNTSWAKNKLTNRLRTKTNSDWTIGSVLWMPFGDVELNDLETNMGEGGISVKSLSVDLSWSELISGSVELMEANVTEAEIDIDLKWLKENLNDSEEIILQQKSAVAQSPQNNRQPNTKKQPSDPATRIVPKPNQKLKTKPNLKPEPAPIKSPEIEGKVESDDLPTRWLKVDKINLTLRNGKQIIEQVTDLSATIPFAGSPADGEVSFTFLGDKHIQEMTWNGQELNAEQTAGKMLGVEFQWKGACRISQLGTPFVFHLLIPQQKLKLNLDKPNTHLHVSSDNIAARFSLKGSLRSLNTWRGILNASSEKMIITENQKTHKRVEFDYTRLVGTITNGGFYVPVAEAIGHKTSILANGAVYKNSYSYGVVRVIADNESSAYFEKVHHGARLMNIDQSPYHFLLPLDTPDRRYCDIYIDGKLTDLEIRHNRSNSWQSLKSVLKKLMTFKNNELQEDGLLEGE